MGGKVGSNHKAIVYCISHVLKKVAISDIPNKKAHLSNVFSLQNNSSEMWCLFYI